MPTDQVSYGNVCSEKNKWEEWPAKNGKPADRYYALRFASNARFGKGKLYITAKFRTPFHAQIASTMLNREAVAVMGELTGREDAEGKTWLEIADAKFAILPPKKLAVEADATEDADVAPPARWPDGKNTSTSAEDADLPF
jgi:hypothetical protein